MTEIDILSGKGIAERLQEIKNEKERAANPKLDWYLRRISSRDMQDGAPRPGKITRGAIMSEHSMTMDEYAKAKVEHLKNRAFCIPPLPSEGRGKPAMCGPKYLQGIEYPCDGSCCGTKPERE